MNQPDNKTPSQPEYIQISHIVSGVLWRILEFALKAAVVMFLWNSFLSSVLVMPSVEFGNAFAIVVLVSVLFSNLNGHSKYHTQHLFHLKHLVHQLVINQHNQNLSIMSLLSKKSEDKDDNKGVD